MKKTLLALSMMLMAGLCFAQAPATMLNPQSAATNPNKKADVKTNYNYRLDSYFTDDNHETSVYHYDSNRRLVGIFEQVNAGSDSYEVMDSLKYDSQNHIVRLEGWQHLGNEWRNVYYVDYTYDANGNVASRMNYNNFGGTFQLGGIYTYTYNAQNQITCASLEMGGINYQRIDYLYENGNLVSENWHSYNGTPTLSLDEKIRFEYTNGRRTFVRDSVIDDNGDWQLRQTETYVYDNSGNCTEHHVFVGGTTEADRSEYEFDMSKTRAETLMPWHPEIERPKTYNNVNVCTTEHWYTADVDFVLQYICDFIYNYVDIDFVNIDNAEKNEFKAYPNPAKNILKIEMEESNDGLAELLDVSGRQLISKSIKGGNSTLDVNTVAPGIYLLRITSNGTSSTKRVIVK